VENPGLILLQKLSRAVTSEHPGVVFVILVSAAGVEETKGVDWEAEMATCVCVSRGNCILGPYRGFGLVICEELPKACSGKAIMKM
jgi:hypothetical protein